MRDVAPEHQELRRRLLGGEADVSLIQRIGQTGEPAFLPELFPLVFSPNRIFAHAAAEAIRRLFASLAPRDHVRLDEEMRRVGPQVYWRLELRDIAGLEAFGQDAFWLFGLASCHGNGFLRQAGVERLAAFRTGEELPFLLIRVNDWVGPVRNRALAAIEARLTPAYASAFVRWLPLVLRLERVARWSHGDLVARVEALLSQPESEPALREGTRSPDRSVRRVCYRLFLSKTPPPTDVLKQALGDPDPTQRLAAARMLPPGPGIRSLLERLTHDRFPPVRAMALWDLADRFPEEAETLLEPALFDPAVSIRWVARKRLGAGRDFAPVYRQAIESRSAGSMQAAISGLGETGSAADAEVLLPCLTHSSAKIRRAALRALGKLTKSEHVDAFERALRDDAPGVSAEARKALLDRPGLVAPEHLWDLFLREERRHVRQNVLVLLDRTGKWDRLIYLLRACTDSETEIADQARLRLGKWLETSNRGFTRPSPDQLRRAEEALEQQGALLAPGIRRQLAFTLELFRR